VNISRRSLEYFSRPKIEGFFQKEFPKRIWKVSFTCTGSGIMNPPCQSLVNQCFSKQFEQLFSEKNHEKKSPHFNFGILLRFFEPICVPCIWREYLNYSNITWKTKENSFGFENVFKTKASWTVWRPASTHMPSRLEISIHDILEHRPLKEQVRKHFCTHNIKHLTDPYQCQ